MSYDPYDDAWDDHLERLYEEHRGEAIDEFRAERLSSYYTQNPLLAQPALGLLTEAERLRGESPRAATVLATAAAEVAIKGLVLKPMVHGLVHSESAATLVAELTVGHTGIERFHRLLAGIVSELAGADINDYSATPGTPVLKDFAVIQRARNGVLHRGASAADEEAALAIAVARVLVDQLFPDVLAGAGLHAHEAQVCPDPKWRCELREAGY